MIEEDKSLKRYSELITAYFAKTSSLAENAEWELWDWTKTET